jgi:hypothetical protein
MIETCLSTQEHRGRYIRRNINMVKRNKNKRRQPKAKSLVFLVLVISPTSALVPLYHLITDLWIPLSEILIEGDDSEAISTIDILKVAFLKQYGAAVTAARHGPLVKINGGPGGRGDLEIDFTCDLCSFYFPKKIKCFRASSFPPPISQSSLSEATEAKMKLSTVAALVSQSYMALASRSCHCFPGDSCWPSTKSWSNLNSTVGGRLISTVPIGTPCHDPTFNAAECANLQSEWTLPQTQ